MIDAVETPYDTIGFLVEEYGYTPPAEKVLEEQKSHNVTHNKAPDQASSSLFLAQEKPKLYVEDYEISKPILETPEKEKSRTVSHIELVSKLIEQSQKLIQDGEKASLLKVEAVGKRLENNKHETHEIVKEQHQLQEINETWEWRKSVAFNLLHIVSAGAGIGLLALGEPISGSSLLVSGLGGLASSAMSFFGVSENITQPLSSISGLIGAVGSIGGALYNPSPIFETFVSGAQFVSGFVSNIFTGYANYAQSEIQSSSAQYDAKHTIKEKERRLLDEKLTGALTAHKSTVTPLSNIIKGLAKAQKRMNTTIDGILKSQFA